MFQDESQKYLSEEKKTDKPNNLEVSINSKISDSPNHYVEIY